MAIDVYASCPCGSGKKIKFCCGDLATDIERVLRKLEGDQRVAALRLVGQLLKKHPDRIALLDLEASIAMAMSDWDRAGTAVDRMLEQQPNHTNSLGRRAFLLAIRGEAVEAVTVLQLALEKLEDYHPQIVMETLYVVGCSLIDAGHIVAAKAHLRQHWKLQTIALVESQDQERANEFDSRAIEELARLHHEGGLPLLLKDDLSLIDSPKEVPWEKDFNDALILAQKGAWRVAVDRLQGLPTISENDPSVIYNLALLRGYLADTRGLVDGLRHYASLDVPAMDAVEALARANLLDRGHAEDVIDRVRRTYELSDPDKVIELLAADRRTVRVQEGVTTSPHDDSDARPHAARFLLLNRPMPTECDGITRKEMPVVQALLLISGRETDHCGRLVFVATKNRFFDEATGQLESVVGNELGTMETEEAVGTIDRVYDALALQWYPPKEVSPKQLIQLRQEQRHHTLVEIWPTIPQHALGGESPDEAAKDPARRIDLLAALLILETTSLATGAGAAVRELRDRLRLDAPMPIDPASIDLDRISFARMMLLETEKLVDEELCNQYQRSKTAGFENVQAHLARTVVRRPHLQEQIDFHDVFDVLIRSAENIERALSVIGHARELLAGDEEADAMLDVAECGVYLDEADDDGVHRVIEHLRKEHEHNKQVPEMLYHLFASRGLMPQPEEMEGAGPGTLEGGVAGEESASPIWTPDAERAAAAPEDKPVLWTP